LFNDCCKIRQLALTIDKYFKNPNNECRKNRLFTSIYMGRGLEIHNWLTCAIGTRETPMGNLSHYFMSWSFGSVGSENKIQHSLKQNTMDQTTIDNGI
jgi:hypothetical protein